MVISKRRPVMKDVFLFFNFKRMGFEVPNYESFDALSSFLPTTLMSGLSVFVSRVGQKLDGFLDNKNVLKERL